MTRLSPLSNAAFFSTQVVVLDVIGAPVAANFVALDTQRQEAH